jgi:hypothetical protein
MTEFQEGLWACAVIFTAFGFLLLVLHCIGILYRWIRGMFWSRHDKGMICRSVL